MIPGSKVGPYEIVAPLGAGGMGEVFRARDTKLSRDVAIKVLPAEFAKDHERVARFRREAQILASLSHSNIAGIYGLEEDASSGTIALAMEYVEGKDLAERLKRGAIPMDESLAIARQIAEAFEEAHERGIIHRDLKPANVKVTSDGKVKVLDFGLAKAIEGDAGTTSGSNDVSHSPTMTRQGTVAGMILGTAAYMSPEQARGKKVDKRADIWSFGVVLFEMLAGKRLFEGETVSDVLAAVLTRDPEWTALPASTPFPVAELLRRCLDRNPRNRLHDIADARFALDQVLSGATSGRPTPLPPAAPRSRARIAGLFAGGLALGLVVGGITASMWSADDGALRFRGQFEITPPKKFLFVSGLAIAPDGRNIAFVARGEDGRTRLFVRPIDDAQAKELPGTIDARYPFWAPDGRRLGFFAQGRLRVTDLLGGLPRVVAETGSSEDARGAAWGANDRIVFAPSFTGPLMSVDAQGGGLAAATEVGQEGMGTHRFPSFLSDGRRFVFYASMGTGVEPGTLYLGRLGGPLAPKKLGAATSSAVWVEPGYLIYVQGDLLVAHRFDSSREELVGEATPLGVTLPGSISVSGQRSLSVSQTGFLVYRVDKRSATRLVWVDRQGRDLQELPGEVDTWHYGPTISPDGKRLAVSHYEAGSTSGGIWAHDLERNLASRLTADDRSDDTVLVWSPDSAELAYASASGVGGRINRLAVNAPGRPKAIVETPTFVVPSDWLPDGRLIYTLSEASGRGTPWVKKLGSDEPATPLGDGRASTMGTDVSPDGKWMAYQSDPTRRMEVYLRRLDDKTGASTIRVSTDGGTGPRWSRDGRELFYVADSGQLMAVPMKSLNPLRPGAPVALFDARLEPGTDRQYDVSVDGRRFLLNRTLVQQQVPITVMINWPARLGRAQAR